MNPATTLHGATFLCFCISSAYGLLRLMNRKYTSRSGGKILSVLFETIFSGLNVIIMGKQLL